MGAPELLHHLRGAGLVLTLTPAGRLHVAPRTALTDDHRAAIRAERDALALALQAEAATRARLAGIRETDPEVIRHVLAQCAEKPELRQYLFSLTDHGAIPDNRRTCLQCTRLVRGRCMAAANSATALAREYRPDPVIPRRCEDYEPGPMDTDKRPGAIRWPGVDRN
jgi:hypothetical protein